MTDERKETVGWRIPSHLAEAAREAEGFNGEIVAEALALYLGVEEEETIGGIERMIEKHESDLSDVERQIEELEEEKLSLEDKIQKLKKRRGEMREQRAAYSDQLDEILEDMAQTETQIIAYSEELRRAADTQYGAGTESNVDKVIDDLRERALEQSRGIAGYRFRKMPANQARQASADGGQERNPLDDVYDGPKEAGD